MQTDDVEPRRPSQALALTTLAPLRHSIFAAIRIASILNSIGRQLQQVGASWLMTSLSSGAGKVALVTAVHLPDPAVLLAFRYLG